MVQFYNLEKTASAFPNTIIYIYIFFLSVPKAKQADYAEVENAIVSFSILNNFSNALNLVH